MEPITKSFFYITRTWALSSSSSIPRAVAILNNSVAHGCWRLKKKKIVRCPLPKFRFGLRVFRHKSRQSKLFFVMKASRWKNITSFNTKTCYKMALPLLRISVHTSVSFKHFVNLVCLQLSIYKQWLKEKCYPSKFVKTLL